MGRDGRGAQEKRAGGRRRDRGRRREREKGTGQETGKGQGQGAGDWTGARAGGRRKGQGWENVAKSGAVTRGGYEAWAGSKGRGAKSERKKLRCETKRLMRKRMRNQKNSDEKRCDAKQLMRKNDAKYAKKIFLSFAKKMRNSCESDPVSHPFRIDAKKIFARPVHPSSKAGFYSYKCFHRVG